METTVLKIANISKEITGLHAKAIIEEIQKANPDCDVIEQHLTDSLLLLESTKKALEEYRDLVLSIKSQRTTE